MPKKTRRQKIAAEKRRAQSVHTVPQYTLPTNYAPTKKVPQQVQKPLRENNYLYQDIRKTLVLGIFFIAFEIGLFFASPHLGW